MKIVQVKIKKQILLLITVLTILTICVNIAADEYDLQSSLLNGSSQNSTTTNVSSDEMIYFTVGKLRYYRTIMLVVDPSTGLILASSGGAVSFYGYNKLEGMNISEINTLNQYQIADEMNKAVNEKRNFFHFKHRLADRRIVDVHVNSYPMIYKDRPVLVSRVMDVSDQIFSESTHSVIKYMMFIALFLIIIILIVFMVYIRNNEKKYRLLFENMVEGFALHEIIFDKENNPVDYRFIDINPRFEELTGLKRETVLGRSVKEMLPETETYWIENYSKVALSGKPLSFENYSQGLNKYFSCNAFSPSRGKFAVIFSDITDNKIKELEIIKSRDEAQKANKTKSDFLANMNHEIRTPIHSIIGFSDALLKTDLSSNQRDFATNIVMASSSLMGLINDIFDLTSVENDTLILHPDKIKITQLIESVVELLRYKAVVKGLNLTFFNNLQDDFTIMADPVRLRQVLINLLANAVKFTDNGGVSIECAVNILDEKLAAFTISVTDTGVGIDESHRPRLYEAFYQIENEKSRKHGGTGVGLPISDRILKLMGSSLEYESKVGRGSRFYFTITTEYYTETVRENRDRNNLKEISANKQSSFDGTILVVEDEKINMILIKFYISHLLPNAQIIEAYNGLEAVNQAKEFHPELILMDLRMPEMDGIAATIKIRELFPEHPPIIAVTADVTDAVKEECFNAGMNDYYTKPLNEEEMGEIINKYLFKTI